jgi:hypothetical protein
MQKIYCDMKCRKFYMYLVEWKNRKPQLMERFKVHIYTGSLMREWSRDRSALGLTLLATWIWKGGGGDGGRAGVVRGGLVPAAP